MSAKSFKTGPGILIFFFLALFLLSGCFTYYQKNIKLMTAISEGRLEEAEKILSKEKKWEKRKRNRLLFYLNKGTVLWMLNKNAESLVYFQKADRFIEDYQKNYLAKTLSVVANPSIETYGGEDFEKVMLYYYTTLNYLQLKKLDEALIECKRMQLQLDRMSDKYKSKNKYSRDAFAQNLAGLIYDAQKDYNNAFIAYRNAYNIYKTDYSKMFGIPVPDQLKKDLLRTAWQIGFNEELAQFEKEFNMKAERQNLSGDLVFFWNNGLGPVKDQWSINFAVVPGQGGWVNFSNEEMGLNFPVFLGDHSKTPEQDKAALSGLSFVRVAFPKYVERKPVFQNGLIEASGRTYNLDQAQDINAIAFKSLNDRMLSELGQIVLRVALKKAAEAQARKQNQDLGTAVSVLSALAEQADTRNWQSLPHTIYYTRVPLQEGNNAVTLKVSPGNVSQAFNFNGNRGTTVFHAYQTLVSMSQASRVQ